MTEKVFSYRVCCKTFFFHLFSFNRRRDMSRKFMGVWWCFIRLWKIIPLVMYDSLEILSCRREIKPLVPCFVSLKIYKSLSRDLLLRQHHKFPVGFSLLSLAWKHQKIFDFSVNSSSSFGNDNRIQGSMRAGWINSDDNDSEHKSRKST